MDEVEIFMQQYANEDAKARSPVKANKTESNENNANNVKVDSVLDL